MLAAGSFSQCETYAASSDSCRPVPTTIRWKSDGVISLDVMAANPEVKSSGKNHSHKPRRFWQMYTPYDIMSV